MRRSAADFDPVRPVVSNPCTRVLHDDACTPVDHPVTRHAASLFNAAYETMLVMLTRFYTPTEETDQQRSFLGKLAFRPLMTVVMRPLAELLTRMPVATDNHAGRTAGPTFEVASDLLLPRDKAGAWAMILRAFAPTCNTGRTNSKA